MRAHNSATVELTRSPEQEAGTSGGDKGGDGAVMLPCGSSLDMAARVALARGELTTPSVLFVGEGLRTTTCARLSLTAVGSVAVESCVKMVTSVECTFE